jgi:hypothetical protein
LANLCRGRPDHNCTYAAGAIRGNRHRKYRKDRVREAHTRRAVRGALRLGVAAAVAHNARERHEDTDERN